MFSKVPLICCICGEKIQTECDGFFKKGVCKLLCMQRKSWRETVSIMGTVWTQETEDAWLWKWIEEQEKKGLKI